MAPPDGGLLLLLLGFVIGVDAVAMGSFLPVAAASIVFSNVVKYASLMAQMECPLSPVTAGAMPVADAADGTWC